MLLVLFVVFIVENVISAKKNSGCNDEGCPIVPTKKSVAINLLKLIVGAAGIAGGAILLKDNAVKPAELAGISQAVIIHLMHAKEYQSCKMMNAGA